jgi:hypothetical protein
MSLSLPLYGKLFLFTGMERSLGPLEREADVNCPLNKARIGPVLTSMGDNRTACLKCDDSGRYVGRDLEGGSPSEILARYLSNANNYTVVLNNVYLTEERRKLRNEERNKPLVILNNEG